MAMRHASWMVNKRICTDLLSAVLPRMHSRGERDSEREREKESEGGREGESNLSHEGNVCQLDAVLRQSVARECLFFEFY